MESNFIKLKDDISRLIDIFEAETEDGIDKKRTIYSSKDKRLPDNPIVYYHPDSLNELKKEGVLKIIKSSKNVDETAPYFVGSPFYLVKIFAKKVKEKVQAEQTITKQPPKPLPLNVHWQTSDKNYLLKFPDGKKLEFNNINVPSAQYFNLLIENHGLPVDHETAKKRLKKEKNEGIRNLVKTLNEKIEHAMLGTKIKIESEKKAAYTLTISS